MGCTIHLHVELRYQGKWEHYAAPGVTRWYDLFNTMAGVRGRGDPIAEPKGVPDDMSIITRLDWKLWGGNAHTASWFNEEEIDKLSEWLEQEQKKDDAGPWLDYSLEYGVLRGTYMFGNSLTDFKHYPDENMLPPGCDAVRLVFWFDN